MTRPRILVTLTIQFSVRYLLRTGLLRRLAEHVQPVVLISWQDAELRAEMEDLGIEVHDLPETRYGAAYTRVRRQLDTWHLARLASPTTEITRRRELLDLPRRRRVISQLRELRNRAQLMIPTFADRWVADERRLLREDTNLDTFVQLVRSLRVDALVAVTPFHRQEELVARAAVDLGIRTCAPILSFDNITVRGWIATNFDRYVLWNRHNVEQLYRGYPEVKTRAAVVGAPQFDFYWDPKFFWDEATWRTRLGLPNLRPVILYGGGPESLVRHEPHFVVQLDRAIESGEIPDRPIILVRRHPADTDVRWRTALQHAKHVVFDEPWKSGTVPKHSNIRDADIAKLRSTLEHSAVHLNVASTMTVDGAVFDRPQVGPAYDDRPGRRYDRTVRELYQHEHFLPITRSGGLAIVHDRGAMIRAVTAGLRTPGERAAGRKRLVDEIITYTDGRSTDRLLAELHRFLGIEAP